MEYKEKDEIRKPPWRPRKFNSPEQLAEQFVSYTQYVEDNPIIETELFFYKGEVVPVQLRKHRPMTVESFCSFLGVASRTWRHWRATRVDLAEAIEMIEDAIYDQLFCLAAVNLIKPNLINRKLGLLRS